MPAALSLAFELLATTLAPTTCAACDEPLRVLAAFCPRCACTVQPSAAASATEVAAFAYGGSVARAIVRLKYERRPDIARPLGDLLVRAAASWRPLPSASVIVPVPLHPVRLAERGFNQSALLAHRLARELRVPHYAMALRRLRNTPRQTGLARDQRVTNMDGAFVARRSERIVGKRVVLVDDVRTTGSTLEACARALLQAGARDVRWAVVAQTEA
jgi:ComF family protein